MEKQMLVKIPTAVSQSLLVTTHLSLTKFISQKHVVVAWMSIHPSEGALSYLQGHRSCWGLSLPVESHCNLSSSVCVFSSASKTIDHPIVHFDQ